MMRPIIVRRIHSTWHALVGAAIVATAGGCPPQADLGVYTASEPGTTEGVGDGTSGTGGGAEASAPTSGGEGPGSSTAAGESTAGLGGDTVGTSSGTSSGESSGGSSGEPGGLCGDAIVDAPEQCDDGDDDDWDGCQADCSFGPGAEISVLALPGQLGGEQLCCLTAVAGEFIEGGTHALVIGGMVPNFLPDQDAAHVQQVPIPDGGAALWSYLEVAGVHGRHPGPMATMANGDVVMAGQVYTEEQQVDSGGYLWLARFAPDGQLVWSFEVADNYTWTEDIEVTPAGEIVIVGRPNGFTNIAPDVFKFAGDGTPLWQYHEPDSEAYFTAYAGVAVDDDGNIYVAGTQVDYDDLVNGRTVLRGLTPEGALMWDVVHLAPTTTRSWAADLVWTVDDVLLLPATQYSGDAPDEQLVVGAFDTGGGLLGWKQWVPVPGLSALPVRMIAAPDGGAYLGGRTGQQWPFDGFVVRLDDQAEPLWSASQAGAQIVDLTLAPDGFLYALTFASITQYVP